MLPEKNNHQKFYRSPLKVLAILLGLQVFLPFLLYLFLKNDFIWATYVVSALYAISILAVIWIK
jgi:hypothetical protein